MPTQGQEFYRKNAPAMHELAGIKEPNAQETTNDLLRELIGEVRSLRLEIARRRWLPEDWLRRFLASHK